MEHVKSGEIGIRPATDRDIDLLLTWVNDPSVSPFWCGSHRMIERGELLRDLEDCFFDGSDPDKGRSYIIEDEARPVGIISYTNGSGNVDAGRDIAEIDILIAGEENQNRGLGTAALRYLIAILFEVMGFHSILANTYSFNIRMRRCLEKLGFIEEGSICGVDPTNGEYLEEVSYGLLNEDLWPVSINSQ